MGHGTGSQVGNRAPCRERRIGTVRAQAGNQADLGSHHGSDPETGEQACMNSLHVRERESL